MQDQDDKIIKNLYVLLIDTLNLMIFKSSNKIEEQNELIEFNLKELEGDYYTFINPINIEKLYSNNYVTSENRTQLLQLFNLINNINSEKWNTASFLSDREWKQIGILSNEVLLALNSKTN